MNKLVCPLCLERLRLIDLGLDASRAFEDVGHSMDAKDQLKDFYIGDLVDVHTIFYLEAQNYSD